jgi:hypothetical protein
VFIIALWEPTPPRCRDAFLGLAKTCAKLQIAFRDCLGARLAVPGRAQHPQLVRPRHGWIVRGPIGEGADAPATCHCLGNCQPVASPLHASSSNQVQPFQARVPLLADDDVIVHGNAERGRHRDDLLRHLDVGAGRSWIAGRMVVHEGLEVG